MNRDLFTGVLQGWFRGDLLARINFWTFSLPEWSKYSTGRFSARSRMIYGHHAKQKMGAVVGLCNGAGKPAVAAAKRIPGGREPDLAITPSRPSAAVRSGAIHPG